MEKNYLQRAILLCGGQAKLARLLGENVKQAHIWNWLHRDRAGVPGQYVIPIETATKGQVTRYELRPDIFGEEPKLHSELYVGRSV